MITAFVKINEELFTYMEKKYFILAFYHITHIDNPHEEVQKHHLFFANRDVKSRIYISHEGINAQMSAEEKDAWAYMEWLKSDPRFQDVDFKFDIYDEHVFPKTTVKFREQLVAIDVKIDLKNRGEHVSPEKWKEMLEEKDADTMLIDVRNDYEWKIGHFEGAVLPEIETFRQFPGFAEKLRASCDPQKTKVMMYCTGGIRCELYSSLLKDLGFDKVYQLQGGVINYAHKMGQKHWRGKLFVFDDRLASPLTEESCEVIGCCMHCGCSSDVYYNCANMDCNELFLCCSSCAEKFLGCCCIACQESERLRPFEKSAHPKPFRKWYHYQKEKQAK